MEQQQQQRQQRHGHGHGQEQQQRPEPQTCPGAPMVVGGPSELKPVTPEIQSIADSLKIHVEEQLGRLFAEYVVIAYRTQVVAGTNYFFKIHCGKDEYLHVTVYEMLSQAGSVRTVTSAVDGKAVHDAF